MIYKIKLKHINRVKAIEAKTELEAKVKYCEQNKLNYRVYANKLETEQGGKKNEKL